MKLQQGNRCRVHSHIFGPNRLVAGEAAAMVDPMTSNGVTAALRHASEAAAITINFRHRHRNRIPWIAGALYSRRVQDLARFFTVTCCTQSHLPAAAD